MDFPRILPYGQDAALIELSIDDAPDRATRTHSLASSLRTQLPGADVVVGGGVLVVMGVAHFDEIRAALNAVHVHEIATSLSSRTHTINVVYDGPDLQDVADVIGASTDEVVRLHRDREYVVELIGFLPGFGYLGSLDPRLRLPRRQAPRPRVPVGSVAIAGEFTGIYPFVSPGGWHLLGRTIDTMLFDPSQDSPILFAPGDRVRFSSIAPSDAPPVVPDKSIVAPNLSTSGPAFFVEVAPACATIQSAGRQGQLSRGLPPSGPLDPDTFSAANLAVGNDATEAAIEVPLGRFVLRALDELIVSVDADKPIRLSDGEKLEVAETSRAVRYVAIRGGVDVPQVLGSYSTLLVARLGGFSGRPLRRKDVVSIANRAIAPMSSSPSLAIDEIENDAPVDIVVDPGPHLYRFPLNALDVLLASTYRISTLADRVGVRLDGEKIPRDGGDSALPVPMIRGAMQISTDGTPIVFGPDHPTTGGYPVLAVVRRSSWGKLAQRRAGNAIRFVLG